MNKQISLSNLEDELSQVRTKKKEFLEQIERIVPWNEWVSMIKPSYYKGERGNKPYDLELMLRLYLIQNLYNCAVLPKEFLSSIGIAKQDFGPDDISMVEKALKFRYGLRAY